MSLEWIEEPKPPPHPDARLEPGETVPRAVQEFFAWVRRQGEAKKREQQEAA